MEIFVQWLDDLEDLIASLIHSWERLRVRCLQIGLLAALTLLAIEVSNVSTALAPTFALAALASVTLWLTTLLYTRFPGERDDAARVSSQLNA
ncbi:MAG: hypothetical protein ACJ0SL_02840 [Candidatus Rariloculaceae bacterium]